MAKKNVKVKKNDVAIYHFTFFLGQPFTFFVGQVFWSKKGNDHKNNNSNSNSNNYNNNNNSNSNSNSNNNNNNEKYFSRAKGLQ